MHRTVSVSNSRQTDLILCKLKPSCFKKKLTFALPDFLLFCCKEEENNSRCALNSDLLAAAAPHIWSLSSRQVPSMRRWAYPWHRHLGPKIRSFSFPMPGGSRSSPHKCQRRAETEPSRWHLPPRSHGHGSARTACAGCLPPPRALRHRGCGGGGAAARGGGAFAAAALLQPGRGNLLCGGHVD